MQLTEKEAQIIKDLRMNAHSINKECKCPSGIGVGRHYWKNIIHKKKFIDTSTIVEMEGDIGSY